MNKTFFIFLSITLAYQCAGAEFTVNTTTDSTDMAPGNGLCADSQGLCSLRAAVMETNALAGADVIYLPRNNSYALTLANNAIDSDLRGDIDIRDSLFLSIENPLIPASSVNEIPVIAANETHRVFEVLGGQDVTLAGLGIVFGYAETSLNEPGKGGGIRVDSAVTNFNLLNSYLLFNAATFGAGLHSTATNTLVSFSDISYNTTIEPNSGGSGGAAIFNLLGGLRVQYSSIHHNVMSNGATTGGTAVQVGSTAADSFIFSTVISANGRGSKVADTLMAGVETNDASIYLVNTNLTDNTSYGLIFGGVTTPRTLFARNSVFAGNDNRDCLLINSGPRNLGDGAGNGHNLSGDTTCSLPGNSNNFNNTDPKLSQLISVFSDTSLIFKTQYPLGGSPLIDNGSQLAPDSGNPNACHQFDQRLVERPVYGGYTLRCDIGAYELDDVIYRNGYEQDLS
ncbi:MAG: choice-of-anchor Q domain-containing protein [Marinicella sp.]